MSCAHQYSTNLGLLFLDGGGDRSRSNIVNFQEWAVTDIPGQGSLDLNTFLCKQPVSVVVYDFTPSSASVTTHKARWVAPRGYDCHVFWRRLILS